MTPGDYLAYVRDPNMYGVLLFVSIDRKNGLIVCDDTAGDRWLFEPQELDYASKYYTAQVIEQAEPHLASTE